jgi:hypothetical protein
MTRRDTDEAPLGLLERWKATEPVRVALWPVLVAIGALLVGYGVLTEQQLALWLGVAAAVLTLGGMGGELARRGAWAPATVRYTVDAYVDDAYERGWHDALELAERSDEPGDHAADREPAPELPATVESPEARPEPAHPPTAAIPAQGRGAPPPLN